MSPRLILSSSRPSARQRGYTTRWDKARWHFLASHPLCRMCEREGLVAEAKAVDHIVPHKGDMKLFWDKNNWQPLCEPHHNSLKKRIEAGTAPKRIGLDGWAIEET